MPRLPLSLLFAGCLLSGCALAEADHIDEARAATKSPIPRPDVPPSDGSPEHAAGRAPVQDVVAARFSVSESWVTPTLKGSDATGIYGTLENAGSYPVTIKRVSTPAGTASMHQMSMEGGVMKMEELPAITIPPHSKVFLQPGDKHIMVTGLSRPLKLSDSVPVTFDYDNGAIMTTQIMVLSPDEVSYMRGNMTTARPLDHLKH